MPKRNLKGGKSKKIPELIYEIFSDKDTTVKYLPLSSIFISNLTNKYVNMVTLDELRNIIDSNSSLKTSKTIMDIYNNNKIIDKKEIYNNISLTYLDNSLIDNVKLLFQYIIDYDKDLYVKKDVNIYSIITYNELYDDAFETQINIILTDKLFDIRDIFDLLDESKIDLLSDTLFKEIVVKKLKKCSEKPYGLFDLFTGDISFESNKKCNIPSNELLKLNKQNIVFLSEKLNDLSYGDKIKLLILFEHRLSLLSKYFSLEILRRKNQQKSVIKKMLNKIKNLDNNYNKRTIDMVKNLKIKNSEQTGGDENNKLDQPDLSKGVNPEEISPVKNEPGPTPPAYPLPEPAPKLTPVPAMEAAPAPEIEPAPTPPPVPPIGPVQGLEPALPEVNPPSPNPIPVPLESDNKFSPKSPLPEPVNSEAVSPAEPDNKSPSPPINFSNPSIPQNDTPDESSNEKLNTLSPPGNNSDLSQNDEDQVANDNEKEKEDKPDGKSEGIFSSIVNMFKDDPEKDNKELIQENKDEEQKEQEEEQEEKQEDKDEQKGKEDQDSQVNLEESKKTLNQIIDDKLKKIVNNNIEESAKSELYNEFPIIKKKITFDKDYRSYSELLSLDNECNRFDKQVSHDGVIKKGPNTMDLIDKCPDKVMGNIIRNNASKYTFF